MKKCTVCNETKNLDEFHWRNKSKGTKLGVCKSCKNKRSAELWSSGSLKQDNYAAKARRVAKAQDYLWSILSTSSCLDCGETNPIVFEFDHVRGEKFSDISKMVSSNYGLKAIIEEVAKCDIVCANCHKIRTSTRANHWRVARVASTAQV